MNEESDFELTDVIQDTNSSLVQCLRPRRRDISTTITGEYTRKYFPSPFFKNVLVTDEKKKAAK